MNNRSQPASLRSMRPAVKLLGVAFLAVASIYLVGANLVLNTDVLRPLINRREEKLLVEWQSGWTLLPGVVHVEGFRVRGQSKKQQWQCRLARGTFHISLPALAGKTVRITRGRGSRFQFHLRRRMVPGAEERPVAQYFPEIEGLSNPPDPAPEDIYPPRKKKKKTWLIDLSNIDLRGPSELWLGALRIAGRGRVSGGMRFQLRSTLEVPIGRFDLEGGSISLAGDTLVEDVRFDVDMRLTPFVPREVKGTAVLRHMLGRIVLADGEVTDLRVVDTFLPAASGIELVGGTGKLDLDISKESAEEGGHGDVALSFADARLRLAGQDVSGDIDFRAHLKRGSLADGFFEIGETTVALENFAMPGVELAVDSVDAVPPVPAEEERQAAAEPGPDAGEGKAEDAAWWGRLTVDHGTIDLGYPIDIDMVSHFEVKDTRPLLQLFFAKPGSGAEGAETGTKLPTWVKLIPNVKRLAGRASVDLDQGGIVLDDMVVSGEKMDMLARFMTRGEGLEGQLYVRYRIFHVGIDMREGRKQIKLSKPRQWFLSQPELDDTIALDPPAAPAEVSDAGSP